MCQCRLQAPESFRRPFNHAADGTCAISNDRPMNWAKEGPTWPNHEASRFVNVNGTEWHIQQMGIGPQILLLHGSGATTHSFSKVMRILSEDFTVIAVDLPGHGFTGSLVQANPSLNNVSNAIGAVLKSVEIEPVLVVGHSAGAAIGVNMTVAEIVRPRALVAINGAFYPFQGFAGQIFPAAAKLLFLNPFAPSLFAFGAGSRRRVINLIRSTGSRLDEEELDYYQRALMSSDHVAGTLSMMANWDLTNMEAQLRSLDIPVLQIIGGSDGTIDPDLAKRTAKNLKHGKLIVFDGFGHLVHEEIPKLVAEAIRDFTLMHCTDVD